MDDLISRYDVRLIESDSNAYPEEWNEDYEKGFMDAINRVLDLPSAQPKDWMERNKERILQAGMEGREIEFRIGGRLFAIREKAQ